MYFSNVLEFLDDITNISDGLQIPRPLNKRMTLLAYIKLIKLIIDDNLNLIWDFFEDLSPEQVTILINSTVCDETLLFFAASLGRVDICSYLLTLSLGQGREQMCQMWKTQRHPLTAAITSNNRQVIKLIAQNLYDINDTITGFDTPLMLAAVSNELWFIKMVVRLGADVNLACMAGNPLTSERLTRDSARFLVERGAKIDQQDESGDTALLSAVKDRRRETVEYLVEAGADVRVRCPKGYTPLIVSALTTSEDILDYLAEHCAYSRMDRIEAFEIYNAWEVLCGTAYIEHWLYSLEMRKYNHPKQITDSAQEVFELSVEFSTEQELLNIRDNQLLLAYQSVLVIGRIFGFSTGIYFKSIVQTVSIAKGEGKLEKVRELIDYALTISQQLNLHSYDFVERYSMQELFAEIVSEGTPDECLLNGAFTLFQLVAKAASERWCLIKSRYIGTEFVLDDYFINIIDTFLYMARKFYTLQLSAENRKKCFAIVKELVKDNPRVLYQETLLHRALTTEFYEDPCLELIEVLLEAGVDVNSKDYFRQTPLIYAVKHPSDNKCYIIECLFKHGAHLDCQSSEGFYATDFWCWTTLPNLPRDPIALSCQAVRVILDNRLPYETTLPKIMRDFVDLHK